MGKRSERRKAERLESDRDVALILRGQIPYALAELVALSKDVDSEQFKAADARYVQLVKSYRKRAKRLPDPDPPEPEAPQMAKVA